jgi:hypothetical protein
MGRLNVDKVGLVDLQFEGKEKHEIYQEYQYFIGEQLVFLILLDFWIDIQQNLSNGILWLYFA